ncbi:TetR/AcrR family transcriptional regulator [Nonomuraea gerenzanensis]|uniref:Transcriptional regulator, TetR family n=1 Tax=Nonomuraea gerenzanensis TaxID=93944 RepID=A0A1M4E350_9ACTN|nr:TetR/AcrR family transcriptional regulator [Nonomuraea gerenzanensis]UBU15486.1 TetR/AcrR family transcriptional regulator [Nonomuraea gerenzanensis]SBO93247.1 Transcriptional regulator, TetR family [Nonomuraea gerenzanensis]
MGTRDRIIDAAEQAIQEFGIAGATTKRIAHQAACSEALLYKHFANKEEIVLAVLLERSPGLGPALTKLRLGVGQGDLAADLAEFACRTLEFYVRAAPVAGGVLGDPPLLTGFRTMLAKADLGPHLPIQALAEILRAERQAGRIAADVDPDAAACLLMGACFHRANLTHFVDLPDDDASWAATIVRTLFRR